MSDTAVAWATDTQPTANPVARVHDSFGDEGLARARKRTVEQSGPHSWLVHGDARLGDSYPEYAVTLAPGDRKYTCACYFHGGGDVRRAKVCSHVKAVVLWRAKRKSVERAKARLQDRREDGAPPARGVDVAIADGGNVRGLGPCSAALTLPAPSDPMFGDPPLPQWLTAFRPHQWTAVEQILAAYERGARTVFVSAPTGSGKTIIGELSRRLASTSALYVCSTKHLQQQIATDFEYMPVLKGRANYTPTDAIATNLWGEKDARGTVATCADCTRTRGSSSCKWCVDVNRCPYVVAKEDALHSPVAVLNTSYFLAEANGPGRFAKRDLVVCDEADLLEGELMSAVEVRVSKARQKQLHIKPPARKTIESTWVDWVGVTLPIVEARMRELGPVERLEKPAHIREAKGLSTLYAKLQVLAEELPKGGWVYDMDRGDIVFKPVKVDRYGPGMLWAHGGRFLLMSGTIISAQQMAQDLGLKDRWEVVDVPMTFPVENRPVRIGAVVSMTNRDKEVAWPKMCQAVSKLVGLRPGKRMLVHTVSYQLAQEVAEVLRRDHPGRKIITYAEGRAKEAAIASYKEHEGAVIVAPSMDRGVDLPDDLCEVTVVAKVPYPNLGDKQVNARLHSQGGQGWYAVQTVRSIMQMCGRGVRSETDHCETFILDHQFTANVWARNRRLFPAWFVDALDWRFDHRSLTT